MNMIWLLIIGGFILYATYSIDKRIKRLEEVRGPGFSHWFSVNAVEAVIKHKRFGEITGIKGASEGKEYKDWSKADKEKLSEMWYEKAFNRARVTFTYLAGEDAYFVKNYDNSISIVHREHTKNLLYSTVIVGDESELKPHLDLLIFERIVKGEKGKYERMLSTCLEYRDGKILGKRDFQILCDFPLFREDLEIDEDIKQLGFEIKREGGDDVYKDYFGEMAAIPTSAEYTKNGVEIRYVY